MLFLEASICWGHSVSLTPALVDPKFCIRTAARQANASERGRGGGGEGEMDKVIRPNKCVCVSGFN